MNSIYFLNSVKKIFAFNVLFIGLMYSFGQTVQTPSYSPNVFPSHPDQSSLLRVAEQSVSASTGIPDTNIPLYTIKEGDIIYPLQLNYNSEGIRVNEVASSVGMGWNLSVPQIIRSVRGIPDDVVNGFLSTTETVQSVRNLFESCNPSVDPVCNSMMVDIERRSKSGALDLESDIYTAILPSGKSIQFMFNQNRSTTNPKGEIVTFPKSYVKIIPSFSGRNIVSWKVIDIDGIEYDYGGLDKLYSKRSYISSMSDLPILGAHNSTDEHNTGWNIQSIRDIKGRELTFEYERNNFNTCDFVNQTRSYSMNTYDDISTTYVKTVGVKEYLKKISGSFGEVLFSLENREDYNGGKRIKQLIVQNTDGQLKKIVLDYFYTISNTFSSPVYCDLSLTYTDPIVLELQKRLFLEKVHFYDRINNEKETYELEYNPTVINDRFSKSQDWWGFYNGEPNQVLVTGFKNSLYLPNRQINPSKNQAGILKKIKYPTGGHAEFEYENNRGIIAQTTGIDGEAFSMIPTEEKEIEVASNLEWYSNEEYDYIYEIPFQIKNVINYSIAQDGNIYITLGIESYASNCVYPGDLPPDGSCRIDFEIIDSDTNENIKSATLSVNNGGVIPLRMGTSSPFQLFDRNLILRGKVFKGRPDTNLPYDPFYDSFSIKLSWDEYDSNLVTDLGGSLYEIPVGGLRVKSITSKENSTTAIAKRNFSYKNDEGIESAIYNVNLNYYQRLAPGVAGFNSMNSFPLQMGGSRTVIYENFKESLQDVNNANPNIEKIKKNHYFPGARNGGCHYINLGPSPFFTSRSTPCFQHPLNGMIHLEDLQSRKTTAYEYNTHGGVNTPVLSSIEGIDFNTIILGGEDMHNGNPENILPFHEFFYYRIYQFYDEPVKEVTITTHLNQDIIETLKTKYHQQYPFLPIETEQQNSLGEILTTEYQYPQDLPGRPNMSTLVAQNRIADPVVTKTYNSVQTTPLSISETVYENDVTTGNLLLPKYVFAKKNSQTLNYSPTGGDLKITYEQYDTNGNLQQYRLADGTPVSIIWGYNGQYPIAKVEGVEYTTISSQASTLAGLSDSGTLIESSFETLLNTAGALVTCYIYEPLVGVKMIIQPNGQKETYEYDPSGRLMKVKDHEGKELKKIDYHYSTQP